MPVEPPPQKSRVNEVQLPTMELVVHNECYLSSPYLQYVKTEVHSASCARTDSDDLVDIPMVDSLPDCLTSRPQFPVSIGEGDCVKCDVSLSKPLLSGLPTEL